MERKHSAKVLLILALSIHLVALAAVHEDFRRAIEAKRLFGIRCASAGERIKKTIDEVEGIFILKLRPSKDNFSDQYGLDDPYGRDLNNAGYIMSFLRQKYEVKRLLQTSGNIPTPISSVGYSYVQTRSFSDGVVYKFTAHIEEPWVNDKRYLKGYKRAVLDRTAVTVPMPRYGITFDDISTREDRDFWIAGSSLRVIDLRTNEVIAERVGYMFDPQQGSTVGGRSPWLLASNYACPSFGVGHASTFQLNQADRFVEKVLHPSRGK